MPDSGYTIRPMSQGDLEQVLDWAADEGWNPGLHDAAAFLATDPAGFLAGVKGGKPIASISVVSYGAEFGFLGFYIVVPEFRGRGLGYDLWQRGMAQLAGVRTVGLDGVVDQQGNYRKSGYTLAHRNIRHAGILPGQPSALAVRAQSVDFGRVAAFDAAHFPADRSGFLKHWLALPDACSLALTGLDGALTGLGTIRKCRDGWKIGPLFANTPDEAETLLLALAAQAPAGATVFLDTPEPNAAAQALARKYEMAPMFETARMYRGPDPGLPLDRIYGITTFELG
jgi:hypothetical protein